MIPDCVLASMAALLLVNVELSTNSVDSASSVDSTAASVSSGFGSVSGEAVSAGSVAGLVSGVVLYFALMAVSKHMIENNSSSRLRFR